MSYKFLIKIESWLVFWNSLFWLSLTVFIFNKTNFLAILLFSEIIWVTLYVISIFNGSLNDDINLYSMSFFLLALAGLEFSIGILLLILFKNFKIDFFFENNIKVGNQISKKKNFNFLNKKLF